MNYDLVIRLDQLAAQLQRVEHKLDLVLSKENDMSKELTDLTEKVTRTKNVMDSAKALLQGLSAQLLAAKDDPAAIAALAADLSAKDDDLAQAIVDNTPIAATVAPTTTP